MGDALWSMDELARAIGATGSHSDSAVTGVSIDSRTIAPGDVFFAIKGERTDGHHYVGAALDRGASAAVVSEPVAGDAQKLLTVPDTLEALNALARAARARSSARIVGVTGSVGKTGTKEMLRTMLSASGPTHASEKSYNNLWGVPLSLARMPAASQFGVFEIGMNHAGEITPLTKMVRPHVAIITTVAPVHIEFFDSVAGIADAKAEILLGLEPGGHAILPADNEHYERLRRHALKLDTTIVSFGGSADAKSRLIAYETVGEGCRVAADILGHRLSFEWSFPGRHLALNAVAALTAVALMGADLKKARDALETYEVPEGRGRRQYFDLQGGPVLLIDESYNANPASMRAAIEALGAVDRKRFSRRVVILGDMLELGHGGPEFHAELAPIVDKNGIDLVFCAGPLMRRLFDALPESKRGGYAEKAEQLEDLAIKSLRPGDAVMVKGSLGSRMGPLAERLRQHFSTLASGPEGQSEA